MKASTLVFCILTLAAIGRSQNNRSNTVPSFSPAPGIAARHEAALGNRVLAKGKEHTLYVGELIDQTGKRAPAQIKHQLPILVRAEGFRPGRALSFDGERTTGVINKSDEILLEAFTLDATEGMFAMIRNGAAVRHLGNRFGPDPRLNPNYSGQRFDIFQVTGPVPFSGETPQSRVFYFDSVTGLLERTRSNENETRFSAWQFIDGSAYPSRIDHYENGQFVFSFTASTIQASRAVDPAQFR